MINTTGYAGQDNAEAGAVNPFTVMIVDDEDHIVSFIRIRLRLSGYKVVSAGNAFAALQVLREQAVDLAIVDLMMPGIGGLELIEQMRALPTSRCWC